MTNYLIYLVMFFVSVSCIAAPENSEMGEVSPGLSNANKTRFPEDFQKDSDRYTFSNRDVFNRFLSGQRTQKKTYRVISGIDNYRSSDLAVKSLLVAGYHNNVTGRGDTFTGRINVGKAFRDYSFRYGYPLNLFKQNTRLSAYMANSQLIIRRPEVTDEAIELDSKLVGFSWLVGQKWHNRIKTSYALGYENSKSEKLSPTEAKTGCDTSGACESNILVFSADWQRNTGLIQRHASIVMRQGVVLDHAELSDDIEPRFTSFLTKGQITRMVSKLAGMFRLNTKLQYALNSLIDTEKFSLGGVSSVRGYSENALVRDNAFLLSSEWIKRINLTSIYVSAFIDYGVGWNSNDDVRKAQMLSLGGGIAWRGIKTLNTEIFLGLPMLHRPDELGGLQDYGVHFAMQYQIL